MVRTWATAAALAILLLVPSLARADQERRIVEVAVPRAAPANEAVELAVQVGVLARGSAINVTTAAGILLGKISPFGNRPGEPVGTYRLKLPPDAIRDGRIVVSLSVSRFGEPARAPTADEVRGISVTYTRIAP